MTPNPDQAGPPVHPLEPSCLDELYAIYRAAPAVLGNYLGEDLDVDSLGACEMRGHN